MFCGSLVKQWRSWRRYFIIIGGIFIYLPIGVPWYFGNLTTYISSYFHARTPSDTDLVDPQWIFSAFFITFSLAIIGSGYLSDAFGPRVTISVAMIVHSGATFVSYFAIQQSMIALITTFGALGGLGAGLAYGPPLPIVIKWMPRRMGLASGALMTGFGGGAIFYNELITFFINPRNLRATERGARTSYFNQPEILNKVPYVFLMLGSMTVFLQIIGICLLRLPVEGDETESVELQEIKPIIQPKEDTGERRKSIVHPELKEQESYKSTEQSKPDTEESNKSTAQPILYTVESYNSTEQSPPDATESEGSVVPSTPKTPDSHGSKPGGGHITKESINLDGAAVLSVEQSPSLDTASPQLSGPGQTSPMGVRDLLRSRDFYILWFVLAFNHYGYIIKNNYYKEFGQLRIDNDHFLTTTGTVATVGVSVGRFFWGLATDYLGTKLTLMLYMASTCIFAMLMYFSLYQSPGLYMFAVVMISVAFTGAFILIPLSVIRCFGEDNYSTNYGLVLSSQIVLNLISPPIIRVILQYYDWFWLYFSIGAANALGVVALFFLRGTR